MNKKNTFCIFLSILLVSTFFSCSTQEKKVVFDIQSMPSIPLEGELMEEELLAPYTIKMAFIQSKLFHFAPQHEVACLVTNEYADTLGYVGSIGGGPGEMNQWPEFVGTSVNQDTIFMFDTMSKHLNAYSLDTSSGSVKSTFLYRKKMKEDHLPERLLSNAIFSLRKLENGYYVGLRNMNHKDIFTLFDKDLKEIKRFGDYPIREGLETEEYRHTSYFDGPITIKGNSIYYAVTRFAYMARYDINDNGEVKKVWERKYAKTRSTMSNNKLRFYPDNIEGFSDLAVGKKYIFASYSGIESGEAKRQRNVNAIKPKTLMVFNLEGTPLAKFSLDKRFTPLCLDEKEEYLYIKHNEPDMCLWRYKVSDILKHL